MQMKVVDGCVQYWKESGGRNVDKQNCQQVLRLALESYKTSILFEKLDASGCGGAATSLSSEISMVMLAP